MKSKTHVFMPTETINGVIKKVNLHNVTAYELETLIVYFNEMNGRQVPKPGRPYQIPILDRVAMELGISG